VDGGSTDCIENIRDLVAQALHHFSAERRPTPNTPLARLEHAARHFAGREFARKDYGALFPHLSTSTASRDLRRGVDSGKLRRSGRLAMTRYRVLPGG